MSLVGNYLPQSLVQYLILHRFSIAFENNAYNGNLNSRQSQDSAFPVWMRDKVLVNKFGIYLHISTAQVSESLFLKKIEHLQLNYYMEFACVLS